MEGEPEVLMMLRLRNFGKFRCGIAGFLGFLRGFAVFESPLRRPTELVKWIRTDLLIFRIS